MMAEAVKSRLVFVVALLTWSSFPVLGKVYERCELARELRDFHEISDEQVATWVCIARYESEFNTSAVNPGSGDHGLFQISDIYWCSPPGHGYACGLPCSALEDDDIEDDVVCARRIYREHTRISGDGFNAWVVYNQFCKNNVDRFVEGCFGGDDNAVKYQEERPFLASNITRAKLFTTPTPAPTSPIVITPRQRAKTSKPTPNPKKQQKNLVVSKNTKRPNSHPLASSKPSFSGFSKPKPQPYSQNDRFSKTETTKAVSFVLQQQDETVHRLPGVGKSSYLFSRKGNGFKLFRVEN